MDKAEQTTQSDAAALGKPFGALATFRMGQAARIVAEFDTREAAAAYIERAVARYDEIVLVVR